MVYQREQIGKKIRQERVKYNLSQTELGQKIGVVGKQVSNYEKGVLLPPLEVMLKLCEVFDCELGYLLCEEEYTEKTKLLTEITNYTGLTIDTVNSIQRYVLKEKTRFGIEREANTYRYILNSFLSSPYFGSFLENLYNLNSVCFHYDNAFDEIKEKTGEKAFDEAFKLYCGSYDYTDDLDLKRNKPYVYKALIMIDEKLSDRYDLEIGGIPLARYNLQKAFDRLIEDLYPKKLNE